MDSDKVYDNPSDTEAVDGVVAVDGPDGVAVRLTPGAAIETSHRLLETGLVAQGQVIDKRRNSRPADQR
jgi:hypothetical protein